LYDLIINLILGDNQSAAKRVAQMLKSESQSLSDDAVKSC